MKWYEMTCLHSSLTPKTGSQIRRENKKLTKFKKTEAHLKYDKNKNKISHS